MLFIKIKFISNFIIYYSNLLLGKADQWARMIVPGPNRCPTTSPLKASPPSFTLKLIENFENPPTPQPKREETERSRFHLSSEKLIPANAFGSGKFPNPSCFRSFCSFLLKKCISIANA